MQKTYMPQIRHISAPREELALGRTIILLRRLEVDHGEVQSFVIVVLFSIIHSIL